MKTETNKSPIGQNAQTHPHGGRGETPENNTIAPAPAVSGAVPLFGCLGNDCKVRIIPKETGGFEYEVTGDVGPDFDKMLRVRYSERMDKCASSVKKHIHPRQDKKPITGVTMESFNFKLRNYLNKLAIH